MYNELDQVYSRQSLLHTAKSLRDLADQYEAKAERLDRLRDRKITDHSDLNQRGRILTYIRKLPNFLDLSAAECRTICDKFFIDDYRFIDTMLQAAICRKREISFNRIVTMHRMNLNGRKSIDICKALDVSKSYVSQVLKKGITPEIRAGLGWPPALPKNRPNWKSTNEYLEYIRARKKPH